MTQLNAYLNFNGNCREAMTFYKECLGGELVLQPVAGTPMAQQLPAEAGNMILHASLNNGALILMGSDMNRGNLMDGNTVHLCLNCSSESEIKTIFSKLAMGGQITEPLAEMSWGATFGALTDKFGKSWMFNFNKNQKK
jgi:PhnB protein